MSVYGLKLIYPQLCFILESFCHITVNICRRLTVNSSLVNVHQVLKDNLASVKTCDCPVSCFFLSKNNYMQLFSQSKFSTFLHTLVSNLICR